MVTIEFFLQVVSDSIRYKIAVCDDSDADRSYVLNMVHAWSACAGHTVLYCFKNCPISCGLLCFFLNISISFFLYRYKPTGDKKQLLLLFFHEQRFLRLSHKFPSFYSISDYLSVKKLPSLRSEIFLKKIKKETANQLLFFLFVRVNDIISCMYLQEVTHGTL